MPGEVYTLAMIDYGPSGYIAHAAHQPGLYPPGARTGHNRAYPLSYWAGPYYEFEDLAFRVVTSSVPEPSLPLVLLLIVAVLNDHALARCGRGG
jgi:hypothetical protein